MLFYKTNTIQVLIIDPLIVFIIFDLKHILKICFFGDSSEAENLKYENVGK